MTALLVDALVSRGHDVTLFATGSSITRARLHAVFDRGYCEDSSIWPWELCELFNLAAAVEQGAAFDVIHYQAEYSPMSLAFSRLSATPVLQTLHHLPTSAEIALWSKYRDAPFVAVSQHQARALAGLNVVAVIPHAIDTAAYPFRSTPDDYLLFLGRFSEGKGVLQAIEAARRTRMRLILAAAENEYYREVIAPLVDGDQIVYAGEVAHTGKAALLGGATGAAVSGAVGRAFWSRHGRGDGVRDSRRCARSRRRLRSRRRGNDRSRVRLSRRARPRPAGCSGARSRRGQSACDGALQPGSHG